MNFSGEAGCKHNTSLHLTICISPKQIHLHSRHRNDYSVSELTKRQTSSKTEKLHEVFDMRLLLTRWKEEAPANEKSPLSSIANSF